MVGAVWYRTAMKATLLLSSALLSSSLACSSAPQDVKSAPPGAATFAASEEVQAQVDRIIDTLLEEGQAYSKLGELCRVAPHRLSGSPGAATAVEWARQQMIADGLENVRLEPCTVPRWVRGQTERLTFSAPANLAGQSLPLLALGGSIATPPGGLEAEVVVVQSFEQLADLGEAARGKIVLFNRPMQDSMANTFPAYGSAVNQRVGGADEASKAGALASISRSMTTLRDDRPHTGTMRYSGEQAQVPAAAISTNGADQIAALVASGVRVRLRLELDCRTEEPVESFNVVGELVGTEFPDEVIVIGGHLDAWDVGEGAHDDGAGCVQSMEALRVLKQLGLRPRRTLRCVLFMNEENGTAGGKAYYQDHLGEMQQHVMALESDSGGFTPRGFGGTMSDAAFAIFEQLIKPLARTGATIARRGGGGADIGPMGASQVPLVGYLPDSQRYFDYHHSEADLFSAVNARELHLGAAAMAGLVWQVANLDAPLPRDMNNAAPQE